MRTAPRLGLIPVLFAVACGAPSTSAGGGDPGAPVALAPDGTEHTASASWALSVGGGHPSELGTTADELDTLAEDDTDLYVHGTCAAIHRISKKGGEMTTIAAADDVGDCFVDGIVADETSIYWTALDGGIRRAPKTGGPVKVLASGEIRPWGIAVDDANVYWAAQGDEVAGAALPPKGNVRSVPKTGGAITTLAKDQQAPTAIALDADAVYFACDPWGDVNASVRRVAKTGGEPAVLVDRLGQVRQLAVEDSGVFYLEDHTPIGSPSQTSLVRIPTTGGARVVLDPEVSRGGSLYASPGSIIYSELSADTRRAELRLVPADGSRPPVVVGSRTYPANASSLGPAMLVSDATNVYFVDFWWNYAGARVGSVLAAPLSSYALQ